MDDVVCKYEGDKLCELCDETKASIEYKQWTPPLSVREDYYNKFYYCESCYSEKQEKQREEMSKTMIKTIKEAIEIAKKKGEDTTFLFEMLQQYEK